MKNNPRPVCLRPIAMGVIASAMLVACGGGGSDGSSDSAVISGKAVDGALQGAIACYDLNDNLACDSGDPRSSPTGADGSYSIAGVTPGAVGKHAVVVEVPATAIDADTGAAVGRAFAMLAPATDLGGSHSVFVSPLSTLVVLQMQQHNQTRDQAVAFVQSGLGLAVSPLADFTGSSGADGVQAANAARITRAAQNQQADALAAAVGQTDASGAVITRADVDQLAANSVLGSLPMIGGAAVDTRLSGLTGAGLTSTVGALATEVVAQRALTAPDAVASIGGARLAPDTSAEAPQSSGTLAALRYTSASDWYLRSFQSTAQDNTPDASGRVRYTDVRTLLNATNPGGVSWLLTNDPTRAGDTYWSGTAWRTCPLGTRSTSTQRDAAGRSRYDYCDGYEKGNTVRSSEDISGQTLVSVLTEKIRTQPGGSSGVNFADWGPTNLGLLGSATFPEGSRLLYQLATPLESAPAYAVRDLDRVGVFSQAVADGGNARAGTVACQNSGVEVPATSLEEMIARRPGRPCIFGQASDVNGTGLSTNELWGLTTVSLGDVTNGLARPAGTGNFYTTTARMRVSFTGVNSGTVYHQCYQATSNGSPRNCTQVGTGTYTITTLGDGRVMTFNNLPASVQRLSFTRIFVERNGQLWFGYRNRVGQTATAVRLNLTAANTMLSQLGLPVISPTAAP